MLETLSRNWWLVALRGLLALIVGTVMLVIPETAAVFLVLFIGAYALVDGIFALVMSIKPAHRDRWWLLIEGIIGIAAGVAIFIAPLMATAILAYIIGFWALLTGVAEIIFAALQWKVLPDKWLMLMGGIFSIILGIIILSNVTFGAVLIITIVAVYMVLFGVAFIALGFSLKNVGKKMEAG